MVKLTSTWGPKTAPKPTVAAPSEDALLAMMQDAVMDTGSPGFETTDGCEVEPDGICEHGHETWLRHMGLL
jgi:hypothetical protein